MTSSTVTWPPEPAALSNALAALDEGASLLEEACRELWSAQQPPSDGGELAMAEALRDLRHEVRNPLGGTRVPLPVSPGELRAVLWNLVRNAAEVGALGRSAALGVSRIPAPLAHSTAPASVATVPSAPLDAADPIVALLRQRGVGDAIARALGREARASSSGPDDLAEALRHAVTSALTPARALDPLGRRSIVVLGPSGAGKTSTLAKIAADAVARDDEPVLVCADGESLAGEDALAAIGAALSLTVESAFVEGHLEQVIARHGAKRAYFVDTPGRSAEEPGAVEGLQAIIDAIADPIVLLVAAASTEADELRRLVHGFEALGVDGLVLTRLDETARPGRLLNLAQSSEPPVAWITFGRSARGAAAPPNDPRVVARILGPALAVESVA